MRWWYLQRAIPWVALLACCGGALICAALVARWPGQAGVLLPSMLACCGAAAGFCFDEPAPALAEVTPRGSGWRRGTRMSVAALPLLLWAALVAVRPGRLSLDRPGWWLAGLAAILLAVGLAALAARHGVGAPGSALAASIALGLLSPLVVGLFVGSGTVYPMGPFDDGALAFWAALAAVGASACAAGLRPGPT
jgi:hypothetical protein